MRIKNWGVFLFIAGYHALLIALIPTYVRHFSWASVAGFILTFIAGGMAITAGYHRLFSHKTYSAHPLYEWATLIASTLAIQWSALAWSHDHRLHHNHVDTDEDPYNIKRGFLYAHVWWLFVNPRSFDEKVVPDLLRNPRVMFQHKHYVALTIATNVAVFLVGCLFMHPVASFFALFLLRVFAIHHCTWFINSLAHTWGSKTYARELTAVDNAIMAFLTFGEGYHNYHHAFATDYRNGIRWYHFDPTKWIIWCGSRIGITHDLRSVDSIRVQKILVKKDKRILLERLSREIDDTAAELRHRLEELSHSFETKASALVGNLNEFNKATADKRKVLLIEIRRLKKELRVIWQAWLELTRIAINQYQVAHVH